MTQATGSILTRKRWLGGATSGYILLAGTAIFLLNVLYQAVQFQVFNAAAAAMIGMVAIYSLIAIAVIAAFSRRPVAVESTLDVSVETNHLGVGDNGGTPGRPNLRLVQLDSLDSPTREDRQKQKVADGKRSHRAA